MSQSIMTVTMLVVFSCLLTAAYAAEPQPDTPSLGPAVTWDDLGGAPPVDEPVALFTAGDFTGGRFDGRTHVELAVLWANSYMPTTGVPMQWTGSVAGCLAGDVSSAYRSATHARVNVFRSLVGLPDVAMDSSIKSLKCQDAALIFSANNALSHTPPSNWACYTADGYEAASKSNIALGNAGPNAVNAYINDSGTNNAAVGHRRWILYPRLGEIGSGSVDSGSGYSAANSLWVIGNNVTRPSNPTSVSWPPHGHFPYELVPTSNRWSLSAPGANFASASVSMTGPSGSVSVVIENQGSNGYGDNTIIFNPDPGALPTSAPATPQDYTVTVSGVTGTAQSSYTWTVSIIDPLVVPVGFERGQISGTTSPITGVTTFWSVLSDGESTGLGYRAIPVGASGTVSDDAEALTDWIDATSGGYTPLTASGAGYAGKAFHLAMPVTTDQVITWDKQFYLASGASLSFYDRLNWATTGQVVSVEVSEDDVSWAPIYERALTVSGSGDGSWLSQTPSLAAYEGRVVRFRLRYRHTGGSYYPQTGDGNGWRIDNLLLSNVRAVSGNAIESTTTSTDAIDLSVPLAGTYALQSRTLIAGEPVPWWSDALVVTASDGVVRAITLEASDAEGVEVGIPQLVDPGPAPSEVTAGWLFTPLNGSVDALFDFSPTTVN